tara:strand:+ start:1029 stop:1178 length:150 start_codon:yes stop_codon:yes gene_type:complete
LVAAAVETKYSRPQSKPVAQTALATCLLVKVEGLKPWLERLVVLGAVLA